MRIGPFGSDVSGAKLCCCNFTRQPTPSVSSDAIAGPIPPLKELGHLLPHFVLCYAALHA